MTDMKPAPDGKAETTRFPATLRGASIFQTRSGGSRNRLIFIRPLGEEKVNHSCETQQSRPDGFRAALFSICLVAAFEHQHLRPGKAAEARVQNSVARILKPIPRDRQPREPPEHPAPDFAHPLVPRRAGR